jgi:hypothetical protein
MLAARPQKISFGEMRGMGVRGVLIYCADYHWSGAHSADSPGQQTWRHSQRWF